MNDTQKQKLEELQKLLSEMKLENGDVVLVKVQNVVAMASKGDVVNTAGNAMLPMLNYVNDLAKQHVDASAIAVKLMVLQLVAGLHAALEHYGVSEEKRAEMIAQVLGFPLSNAELLAAAISTAEDFMYNLPREVKANIHTVVKEESLLEKIKRHLA